MGLDMYLYKFSKPRETVEELNKKSANDLRNNGCFVFYKDDELPDNFDSIRHLASEVSIDTDYINYKKIRQDFNIPTEARLIGQSYYPDCIGYTFSLKSQVCQNIKIPIDEFEAKYVFTRKADAYCIEAEQVGYWRKYYDLQDAFYEACDTQIENCGYYPLNDEMWEVLRQYDDAQYATVEDYRNAEDCLICYHEWY